MSSPKIRNNTKPTEDAAPANEHEPKRDRERLRDILVVFVFYPITPTERTEEVAESKPWLEFLSLLLKVALAAYALWDGIFGPTT